MKSEQSKAKNSYSGLAPQFGVSSHCFIQARELCYQSSGKEIVSNLSFQLNKGERVALVGLNGAGKSSLLKLMVGEFVPSSGEIKVAGVEPNELVSKERIGYQASDMLALPGISVKEYLELVLNLKLESHPRPEELIGDVIEQWNLESIVDKDLGELSQGNMQKVAIAQAFLHKPQFLFLDEPTQALDPVEQERFINNLSNLEDSQSCIFSSHHVSEAVASSDKVMMIHQGKLIAVLDLSSETQSWYVIANEAVKDLLEFDSTEVVYQSERRTLILAYPSNEGSEKLKELLLADSDFKNLGASKQAIMPLFSMLANQEL